MMARRRTLRPDEEELWQTVARSTNPLHAPGFITSPAPKGPLVASVSQAPSIPLFSVGEKVRTATAHRLAPTLRQDLTSAPIRMDAKAFGRMTRGKLAPEARIDLHGLTLAEAHPALIRFILNAQGDGLRLVLVITGKGKRGDDTGPIPQRMGALRHQVPQWLRMPPMAPAVLQVAEAHLKHGGAGAYYVYLRRG
jgi:DNA-nicking Smr family endonuclease